MSLKPVVAAAILDDSLPPRLLAARRSYPPALEGLYELPGGKVEPDEDAATALQREIFEELGTRIVLEEPLPASGECSGAASAEVLASTEDAGRAPRPVRATTPRTERRVCHGGPGFAAWTVTGGRPMWVWLARIAPAAPEPQPGDSHRDLTWVGLAEALDLPWIPADIPIVEAVLEAVTRSSR